MPQATEASETASRAHDAGVFRRVATQLALAGDLPHAEMAALLSARLDETDPRAWANLGAIRARAKDHPGAVEAYLEVLKRSPTDIEAWTNIGELYIVLLDFEKAAAALRQAMQLDPQAKHPAGRRARIVVAFTVKRMKK